MGNGPMATTHRSDLVEQLEKALTDEAYDGGNGALSEEQFSKLVRRLADTAIAVRSTEPITLEDVYEATSLKDLIDEARSDGAWCCENGCGSGACETCPCCSAGWCVSGVDGIPEEPEARLWWLEVASEHNPVAAALRAVTEQGEAESA